MKLLGPIVKMPDVLIENFKITVGYNHNQLESELLPDSKSMLAARKTPTLAVLTGVLWC
jgi:hypothetical protein